MTTQAIPLHHSIVVDTEEREGQVLDAGVALLLVAEAIGAEVVSGERLCIAFSR